MCTESIRYQKENVPNINWPGTGGGGGGVQSLHEGRREHIALPPFPTPLLWYTDLAH